MRTEKKERRAPTNRRGLLIFRGGLVAVVLAAFVWLAQAMLLEASLFLVVGVAYSIFVWRIASKSGRAFNAMLWSLLLNYTTLISIDVNNVLAVPAATPWFLGFLAGALVGGYVWLGPRAGTEFAPKNKREPDVDGTYAGDQQLALINAFCALLLLVLGVAQLLLLSPTPLAAGVLVTSCIAGWVLFRFPPALPIRNWFILLGIPIIFFALVFVGGSLDQTGLSNAWAYGVSAGILIGGRYWSGPRFGAPRPPFNSQDKRRRRRPKKRQPERAAR